MLIVGGGAALAAIAAWFVWVAVKSLRASWRARRIERPAHRREDTYRTHEHESVHSSF
jgi:uncharacterized membrane protein YccC